MKKIRIEEVSKCFGKEESKVIAIDDVSFEIEQGAFVTILGPSGSGKTTLLRCICGIEAVDKGKIFIGNTEITRNNITHNGFTGMDEDVANTAFVLMGLVYCCALTRIKVSTELIKDIMGRRFF